MKWRLPNAVEVLVSLAVVILGVVWGQLQTIDEKLASTREDVALIKGTLGIKSQPAALAKADP